jgi:hypothetical protein
MAILMTRRVDVSSYPASAGLRQGKIAATRIGARSSCSYWSLRALNHSRSLFRFSES